MSDDNQTIVRLTLACSLIGPVIIGANWFFGGTADSRNAVKAATEQVQNLSKQVEQINSKIDLLPRAGDFVERDRRLTDLATTIAQHDGRIGRIEADTAALRATVNSLTDGTQARIRTPR